MRYVPRQDMYMGITTNREYVIRHYSLVQAMADSLNDFRYMMVSKDHFLRLTYKVLHIVNKWLHKAPHIPKHMRGLK